MPILTAAILRLPRDHTSPFFNKKQVASHEAAESNVRCPLLQPETKTNSTLKGESLSLVFHPVLTNDHLKPEMTEYNNRDHDLPNASLLHIPPELIIRILRYLSPKGIISCRRTCRTMYNVCNDPFLRYLVQMECCGVGDDIRPGLCYPDRLRILERREKAWAMLDFRNSLEVQVPFDLTGMYELKGGTLLLGTRFCAMDRRTSDGYSYVSLPSVSMVQDQKLQWMERDIGVQILDVGLAVHEHDLIAALTVCVFLLILSSSSLDFREGERTMVADQMGA